MVQCLTHAERCATFRVRWQKCEEHAVYSRGVATTPLAVVKTAFDPGA